MALSPKVIKYIAVTVVILVVAIFVVSSLWDFLKTAIGVLIGVGLVVVGFRVMMGKGLPDPIEKAVNKATGGKDEKKDD